MAADTGALVFRADTGEFIAPLDQAAKAALNVATSAEEARQRIVASYKQQVQAAKEAGASQRELESITRRSASALVNVTDDSARRYINKLDQMEERTRKFNAARTALGTVSPTSEVNLSGYASAAQGAEELAQAVEHVNEEHSVGVTKAVQFGSVIRGMEGNFSRNIRAAEAFGSTISALGPIVEKAFPVVGAVTLGYAIYEMGKRAYEAFENIVNLKGAIEGLNKLQIQTDNQSQRDKDKVEEDVESILEKTQGRAAALKQKYSYQSNKPTDISSLFYADEFKKLQNDVKGNYESLYKTVAPADLPGRLSRINSEIKLLNEALESVKNPANFGVGVRSVDGLGPNGDRDPAAYWEARLNAANQIRSRLQGASDVRSAGLQSIQVDSGDAAKKDAEKAAQASAQAHKQAMELQRQQWEQEFAGWEAAGQRSAEEIAQFWAVKAAAYASGSENFNFALKKADEELVRIIADTTRQTKDFDRAIKDLFDGQQKSVQTGPDLKGVDEDAKNTKVWVDNVGKLRQANLSAGYGLDQFNIQQDLANGRITKTQAAYQTAALHAKEYSDALQELNDIQEQLNNNKSLTDSERKAQQSGIDLQRGKLDNNNKLQSAQDGAAVNAAAWASTLQAVSALNQTIAQTAVTGNGNWSGLFQQLGSQLTTSALKLVESPILSAFGLGKADGSAGNPLHVVVQDFGSAVGGVLGKAGSGIGGFVSQALGFFSGRAVGGNVDANGTYLVGERGPEVLTLGATSGRVTPNNMLGGTSHQWNIDAKGSNDPASVEAAVRRGIAAAAPHIVSSSVAVTSERRKRLPSTVRN